MKKSTSAKVKSGESFDSSIDNLKLKHTNRQNENKPGFGKIIGD